MDHKLKGEIEKTFQFLDARRQEAKALAQAADKDDPKFMKYKTAAYDAKRSVENFHTIVNNVPSQFVLTFFDVPAIDGGALVSLRKEFNSKVKEKFYRDVFRKDKAALVKMKVGEGLIKRVCRAAETEELFKAVRALDVSVDHDRDLFLGGSNDMGGNLRLVPHHINQLRNIFLMQQRVGEHFPAHGVLTLSFRGKERVPVFSGGFRPYDETANTMRKRIKEDCGIELTWA